MRLGSLGPATQTLIKFVTLVMGKSEFLKIVFLADID